MAKHPAKGWLYCVWLLGLCLLGGGPGPASVAAGAQLPSSVSDSPQVCTRSVGMRGAILDALPPVGGETPACEDVTWTQLAGIRELGTTLSDDEVAARNLLDQLAGPPIFRLPMGSRFPYPFSSKETPSGYDLLGLPVPVPVMSARDLVGLTGLEALAIHIEGRALSSDLLAPVPQLIRLEVNFGGPAEVKADFLAPVSRLTHLTLNLSGSDTTKLPTDFLVPVPRLTHLTVMTVSRPRVFELPTDFLAPVPHLSQLNLQGVNATLLPSNFLAPVPQLTHLELRNEGPTAEIWKTDQVHRLELPTDFLVPVSNLTYLHLNKMTFQLLPSEFLSPVPQLTRLHLVNGTYSNQPLPSTMLAHVPQLTHLHLVNVNYSDQPLPSSLLVHVPNLVSLRFAYGGEESDLLAPVPKLTHLVFAVESKTPPADFLTHVSQLTHLDIGLKYHLELPSEFLAPVPALTRLRLTQNVDPMGSVELNRLSSGFLDNSSQLTHLEIRGMEPTGLPPGFLPLLPRLTHLILASEVLPWVEMPPGMFPDTLPPRFLEPVPNLTHLALESRTLHRLPPDFLGHTPQLAKLNLWSNHGGLVHDADLLVPVPHLTDLTLVCSSSTTPLSAQFLVPVPHLTFLRLCTGDSLPVDFLAPVPNLTHLRLGSGDPLPPGFLTPVPNLTHLVGATPQSADFVASVPRLVYLDTDWWDAPLSSLPSVTHLRLELKGSSLPPGFLANVPLLTHLLVHSRSLEALPPGFLAHAPRLQRFESQFWSLQKLPLDFLYHAPRLTHFTVFAPSGNLAPVDIFRTFPTDFLAQTPSLQHLELPYSLMDERGTLIPGTVWKHIRDHGIGSSVIVTARHTAQVSFPSDSEGVRYDVLRSWDCGSKHKWTIRTGSDTHITLSPAETKEARIHIQMAPPAGMRELQGWTLPDRETIRKVLASTEPRPGMLQGHPLYDRPNRQGKVIGYVPWGRELRVSARYGEGPDAWLRGYPMPYRDDQPCTGGGWLPISAIWTLNDQALKDVDRRYYGEG